MPAQGDVFLGEIAAIFTHTARRPDQVDAIAAFEDLVARDPQLTRVAVGAGDIALNAPYQPDTLDNAQTTIQNLLASGGDLFLRSTVVTQTELEKNPRYATALDAWRLLNQASHSDPDQELAANHWRRRVRLDIFMGALPARQEPGSAADSAPPVPRQADEEAAPQAAAA